MDIKPVQTFEHGCHSKGPWRVLGEGVEACNRTEYVLVNTPVRKGAISNRTVATFTLLFCYCAVEQAET